MIDANLVFTFSWKGKCLLPLLTSAHDLPAAASETCCSPFFLEISFLRSSSSCVPLCGLARVLFRVIVYDSDAFTPELNVVTCSFFFDFHSLFIALKVDQSFSSLASASCLVPPVVGLCTTLLR